jgi:hypothetical protein
MALHFFEVELYSVGTQFLENWLTSGVKDAPVFKDRYKTDSAPTFEVPMLVAVFQSELNVLSLCVPSFFQKARSLSFCSLCPVFYLG